MGICQKDSARSLMLDLMNTMRVDSVVMEGLSCSFIQSSNSIETMFAHSASAGETLSLEIYYEGTPVATGLGSFFFDSHAGVPWVYSLSEPFGAKDWWPCKDDPGDKADSADIFVTCDSTFKVGSQGILVSVTNNGDGTSTHFWKERYPIASYLISIAITNYIQFSNWFRYSETDSMEVLNYVLPEHYSTALQSLPKTIDMLKIFSNLFGQYPFIHEKYGHAEFGRGGAMEHQTMTSTSTFNENTIAHELAHQWFGDMITCRSWQELWLNEGFAQYATALYLEQYYGIQRYKIYMDEQLQQARFARGAVGNPDTTTAIALFNSSLVYSKGASVLHMLRHVLGDSTFFRSLYFYANDPALKYATARTRDFQSVCEQTSGKNLDFFFQEWVYGEGYPEYDYSWNWKSVGDSSVVILDIEQKNNQTFPAFFSMPLDIHITTPGRDAVVSVWNDAQRQRFYIESAEKPSAVMLDPDNWILKLAFSDNERPPESLVLEQNFPNPFHTTTTIIYQLQRQEHVTLKIYDILGREIAVLVQGRQIPGEYRVVWMPHRCASGVYVCRLYAGTNQLQNKMIFLR
jgi:aminopeptidase N